MLGNAQATVMYLGMRSIRSAGHTSGSIEITLPVKLQVLEGAECQVSLRDGTRPEVVLRPDVSAAGEMFEAMWRRLALGLAGIAEVGDFHAADFSIGLFAPAHWNERPPLAYADAIVVAECGEARAPDAFSAGARLVAALAIAAGRRLDLEGALAVAFGDAVAYLVTGEAPEFGADFERGMVHRLLWGGEAPEPALAGAPNEDAAWLAARASLERIYNELSAWQHNPGSYAAERRRWYRGLAVERGIAPQTGIGDGG